MPQATSASSTTGAPKSGQTINIGASTPDPVVALIAERKRLMAKLEDPTVDPESDAKTMSRCAAIDRRLASTRATTPAGGIAALEQLRWELQSFHLTDAPADLYRLCMGLLDSAAVGMLKAEH